MSFKPTPHLLIAGGAMLVTLVVTVPVLLFSGGSWTTTSTTLRIVGPAANPEVFPGKVVIGPLIPEYDHEPELNPFNARAQGYAPGIPPPPPPTLELPPLPMLPLMVH